MRGAIWLITFGRLFWWFNRRWLDSDLSGGYALFTNSIEY